MKAEHRKELETNVLADKVGRMVQGMKTSPQKKTVLYVLFGVAALVVVMLFVRSRSVRKEENADLWMAFENGALIRQNLREYKDSSQGRAAQFERNWIELWEAGIKQLAHPQLQREALMNIEKSALSYEELAKETKGDPAFHPEALYCLAVIEETRMLLNADNWKSALSAYEQVVNDYKDSPFAKSAQQRIDILKKDESRRELALLYQNLQGRLGLKLAEPKGKGPLDLPPGHPKIE